ncbi:hypothetical protein LCGC14_0845380 [marine sediment metagenome]|uniref:Uncharacterized protein n=1 Tax=marine sediment metagenome TaxID=412755 RepID=A0A0F9SJ23_9ZZZZ
MKNITDYQRDQIVEHFLGTCNNVFTAEDVFDFEITPEDTEEALLDRNVEACQGCGWWFESGELVDPDDEEIIGYCEDCRD